MYHSLYGPQGLAIFDHPYNGGRMRLCPVKGYYAPGKRPGLGIGMRASAGWLWSQRAPTARNRHYEQALAVSGGHDRACARQLPQVAGSTPGNFKGALHPALRPHAAGRSDVSEADKRPLSG